jgi:hypothetical protein
VHRKAVILAAVSVALAFPVSASSTVSFPVSTALGGCSAGSCSINVRFDSVSGADSYTGLVQTPNGSSVSLGDLAPGSSSVSVPYVGKGTYTVAVTAWDRGAARAAGTQQTP